MLDKLVFCEELCSDFSESRTFVLLGNETSPVQKEPFGSCIQGKSNSSIPKENNFDQDRKLFQKISKDMCSSLSSLVL